jgi:hypothetical protein
LAGKVKLLTAEEVAQMRRDLDLFPYMMPDLRERVVATLEALTFKRGRHTELLTRAERVLAGDSRMITRALVVELVSALREVEA